MAATTTSVAGPRALAGGPAVSPVPHGGADVARARTAFLVDEPVLPGTVREPLLASWTRSRLLQVRPEDVDLSSEPGTDADPLLARPAEPVQRQVADLFATEPVSVILCDTDGVVASRRTGDSVLEQHLDPVWLAPGSGCAERFVGTNGIGAALEARGPTTKRTLTPLECDAIVEALLDSGSNKVEPDRSLAMSRATIYRKIHDFGVSVPTAADARPGPGSARHGT
jgi:transcriptional regulator of acetoin/glycerol metabolism